MKRFAEGLRRASAGGLLVLLVGAACLSPASARADITITLDDAPGVVRLPDDWRPIPRAEIVESRERVGQATGQTPALPVAAFQRLPTLQWFSLPHALVYWTPAAPSGAGTAFTDGTVEEVADDLQLSTSEGRSPRGTVHVWRCQVLRADGRFRIELFTPDEDGRALILRLAEGLRAAP